MLVDTQNANSDDPHSQAVHALVPSEISRRYRILGKIGAGGSACAYRACVRHSPDTLVAVKLLHQPLTEPRVRRAFERECSALQRLSGTPGIMAVHETGVSQEGLAWIVSELYATNYRTRTRLLGHVPWREATRAGSRIARALDAAHTLDILHRDLKPGNLFIDTEGLVALGDFGSAIDTDRTLTTSVSVSLQFAAPETLQSGDYSVSSDLYALGSSLYYLLTGRLPFQEARTTSGEQHLGEHLHRIAHEPVPRLEAPGAPPALIELVHRLMSPAPIARPESAMEVAYQLDRISASADCTSFELCSDEETYTHPVQVVAPRPWSTPSTTALILIGVCASVLGLVFVATQGMPTLSASLSDTRTANQTTRVPQDIAVAVPGVCMPSSLLCEDFEAGLASWKDDSDNQIASLDTAVGGWTGNALLFEPGEIQKKGASSIVRRFIALRQEEPLRIRTRLKPEQSGPAYWWMNVLQATDGVGNLYSLNFQHSTPETVRFDIFHYSSVNQKGINEPSDVEFPFDNWLCAELLIDPVNGQDLSLYVNGRLLATLDGVRTPGVPVSWELRIGTGSVSDPSAAPRILFDDILVDRANQPAC